MTEIDKLHSRLMAAFDLEGLTIPTIFIKIYNQDETLPAQVEECYSDEESIMSCQAARHAASGNPVLLTIDNVGCVAAAISLGLVDQDQAEPLEGNRVYTCVMHERTHMDPDWQAPSPRDFTQGRVYACHDAGTRDYCLFEGRQRPVQGRGHGPKKPWPG